MKERQNNIQAQLACLFIASLLCFGIMSAVGQCDPSQIQPGIGHNIMECDVQFAAVAGGDNDPGDICYLWDFGDGEFSQEQSPLKTYDTSGDYTVILKVFCCELGPASDVITTLDITIVCSDCELPEDLEIIQQWNPGCNYEFNPSIPLDNPDWCWEWTSSDGQSASMTGNFFVQFVCSGSYEICLRIWCCNDPADEVEYCILVDATCPCSFSPDEADFTVTIDEANCEITVDLILPSSWCPDEYCWHWNFGDGSTGGNQAYSTTHTYAASGTYEVYLDVHCCDNQQSGYFVDKEVVIDCGGCDVDPLFSITELTNCCYLFEDLTPDPNSPPCAVWQVLDSFGIPLATGFGESFMVCAQNLGITSGTVTICHTDCCIDDDGNTQQMTFYQELIIDCPCIIPAGLTFSSSTNDNCELTLEVVGPFDPNQHCVTWIIDGETFDGGSETSFSHQLPPCSTESIEVCMRVYCCETPEIYNEDCAIILVNCPCQLPSSGVLNGEFNNCLYFASLWLFDACPDSYCYEWNFGDGSETITTTTPWISHAYPAVGAYSLSIKIYCCDDPTNFLQLWKNVYATDCYDPVPEEPCEVQAIWSYTALNGVGTYCYQFTDLSSGNAFTTINSWHWDFGDGTTSDQQNPIHCFDGPGPYTVVLTVTGISADGSCDDTFSWTVEVGTFTLNDDCPTDINNDGVTNTEDLLQLLGGFGTECEE